MTNHPNRKQKTIRLYDATQPYTFRDGVVYVLVRTEPHSYTDDFGKPLEDEYEYVPSKYKIGAQAILVSSTNVSPDAIRNGTSTPRYSLYFDLDGVPGNSNPALKSTNGWRGTTNDRCVDAHGIVTITKIRKLKNGDIAVTVK